MNAHEEKKRDRRLSMLSKIKMHLLRRFLESARLEYLKSQGMKVGKDTHIYSCRNFDGGWPWLIEIGDRVTISTNVTILGHDASTNVVSCGTKLGKVKIGNNVFIGTGAIILCGSRIGDNVVIGAGSVVSGQVESGSVYAGCPARRICSIEEYEKKFRAQLETRPRFDSIHKWDGWKDSTTEEREAMRKALEDGFGFVG